MPASEPIGRASARQERSRNLGAESAGGKTDANAVERDYRRARTAEPGKLDHDVANDWMPLRAIWLLPTRLLALPTVLPPRG